MTEQAKGGRIFVPLNAGPFEAFASGRKTVEVRNRDSPVARQVLKALRGTPVTLSLGYGKRRRLEGRLGVAFERDGLAGCGREITARACLGPGDTPGGTYFDPSKPIVAFEVLEVRPCQ